MYLGYGGDAQCYFAGSAPRHSAPVRGREELGVLAPAWLHLDERLQEHLFPEHTFQFLPRLRANFLERRPSRSDHDLFLTGPLHIDGGCDPPQLWSIFPLLDPHRNGVRHFLVREAQNFFAQNLRPQKTFGLIRHVVAWIQRGPLRQTLHDCRPERIEPFAFERGNRDVFGKFVQFLITLDQRQNFWLALERIHLIEHEQRRRGNLLHQIDGVNVRFAERRQRIHQEKHHVRLRGGTYRVHHALIQKRGGLMNPGCIHEYNLRFGERQDSLNGGASGLRA